MSRSIIAAVALVVLLSSLGGVAAGTPGTADFDSALAADGVATQATASSRAMQSGVTYWSGEPLSFDASKIVPSDASEADRTFELWRVTTDGQLNQQIRTFTVPGNGTYTFDTDGFVGRYAVRYGEQIVYIHDGVGYLSSPPDGNSMTVDSSAFALARQSLSFSWSDPSVFPGQRTTLTVTSNRGDYTAAVSGAGLSFQNLTEVFPESAYAEHYDARADQDVLLVNAGSSSKWALDTMALPPGRRSLRFDVVDDGTAELADLTVRTPENDSRFVTVERRENVGDVVEANLSCTQCFLVVGGPGEGILDVVEIEDTDGDGYVLLRINTRYAGMDVGNPGYPTNVEAYTSPEDSVRRYSAGATLETLDEELSYSNTKLSNLRSLQGLKPTGRTNPMDPGEVTLALASSDFVVDRSAWGDRAPFGRQMVVRDQTDVQTLTLEPGGLSGIETLASPGGAQYPENVKEIKNSAGPRDSVALGDHLVFRFDVSGLAGYFQTNGASVATVENNPEEGIHLTVEEITDEGPVSSSLEQIAARVYFDPATDSLYLVLKSGGTSRANLQAGRFRARLRLDGVDGKYGEYSTVDAYTGNPYPEPGETESVSGTATIEPATVVIESPESGSKPHLDTNSSLVIRGTTSMAPGGSIRLKATAIKYAWETSTTATVNETGHWSGSLNLTNAPGDEFTVAVLHDDEQFDEETYTVQPPLENESEEGGTGGSSSGGSSGGPGGPLSDGGLLSGLSGLSGVAVPIGGGLGVIVVVWVIWKLVIRRLLLTADD